MSTEVPTIVFEHGLQLLGREPHWPLAEKLISRIAPRRLGDPFGEIVRSSAS